MTMITIFADASLCGHSGVAGWGAWAKRDGAPPATWSGPLPGLFTSSTEAELAALARALESARSSGMLDWLDTILLQSDSVAALGLLWTWWPAATESRHTLGAAIRPLKPASGTRLCHDALDQICTVLSSTSARVILRHVKGHQPGDGRQWVNRKCDQLARSEMVRLRGAL